jgi:hypothetical protein
MVRSRNRSGRDYGTPSALPVQVDLYRNFVFPNRMREQRCVHGHAKLLRLAASIPEIPYIRLSKIERGEVVPRADELRRIAAAIGVPPRDLLIDIDAPDFDIARWAEPFGDAAVADLEEMRFAVLLGAALRLRRTSDPQLTIAAIERDFGLPPVNLSRVENALKPFGRWSAATRQSLLRLFGVRDEAALRTEVAAEHHAGQLDMLLPAIANPVLRHERTRARIAELAAMLDQEAPMAATHEEAPVPAARTGRLFGLPLAQGLIGEAPSDETVPLPCHAGDRAFGLRVNRATLGAGLPVQSIVIADPDRPPVPGGLAALREEAGWRLLSVGSDRDGRMVGYSAHPELDVPLDDCDPARLASVISAIFP